MAKKLTRPAKKIILLVSPSNRMWRSIFGQPPTQAQIADFLDISKSSISQWRDGTEISGQMLTRILESLRQKIHDFCDNPDKYPDSKGVLPLGRRKPPPDLEWLRDVPANFQLNLEDDEAHVYQAAASLGLHVDECQMILDQVIYDHDLLFPGMGYMDGEYVRTAFRELEGVWYLWMRRGGYFLRGTLRVRYRLPVRGRRAIRCKLNVPKWGVAAPDLTADAFSTLAGHRQSRDHHYWEYDGFVAVRETRRFWTFEKRDAVRRDYINFISGSVLRDAPAFWLGDDRTHQIMEVETNSLVPADRSPSLSTLSGKYLTVDNDEAQSIVCDDFVMQRIFAPRASQGPAALTTMRHLMHFCPAIIRHNELGVFPGDSLSEFERLERYLSNR